VYKSTYTATYDVDTQTVYLQDAVSEVDGAAITFTLFRRLTEMTFGPEKTKKVITALCAFTPVVINWDKARVAVKRSTVDPADEFFRRAMSADTIDDVYMGSQDLGFDRAEYDRNLLGYAQL
jgi:hypothetical protein